MVLKYVIFHCIGMKTLENQEKNENLKKIDKF